MQEKIDRWPLQVAISRRLFQEGEAARAAMRQARRTSTRDIVNALLIRDGLVLLAKRSAGRKAYPGLWSFPGGHVEPGENLEAALARELREETGLTPTKYAFLRSIADPDKTTHERIVYHIYAITEWHGGEPVVVDDEHSEFRWFDPAQAIGLTDLALDDYRPLLQQIGDVAR